MPHWELTIELADIWRADVPFEHKRDIIVSRIRTSGWLEETSDRLSLIDHIEWLQSATNTAEFDAVLNDIYNIADHDRVWLATF